MRFSQSDRLVKELGVQAASPPRRRSPRLSQCRLYMNARQNAAKPNLCKFVGTLIGAVGISRRPARRRAARFAGSAIRGGGEAAACRIRRLPNAARRAGAPKHCSCERRRFAGCERAGHGESRRVHKPDPRVQRLLFFSARRDIIRRVGINAEITARLAVIS